MSRNQVSPSASDIELNRVESGQEAVKQQPGNSVQGSKSSLQKIEDSEQQSNHGHDSPLDDQFNTRPRSISHEKSSLSRLSLKSDDKVERQTPEFTVNQQAYADETQLIDTSTDNQHQQQHYDSDSVALDDHLPEQNNEDSESVDKNFDKREESYIREGATSRFVKDETEGLVYEPGLPTTADALNPVEYATPPENDLIQNTADYREPTEEEFVRERSLDKGYNTETSSVGNSKSTGYDGGPQVFDKEATVFTPAVRGPPIQHVAPNQVRPVDASMYQMSEMRRSHGGEGIETNKTVIIGANENTDGAGCCGWVLYIFSIILIIVSLPFSLIFTIKVVQEYERAVIFRLGRLPMGGASGPGIFFIIPCIESYTKVDLRTVSFDVPPQEILTRDSVTVSVDAVVYYRVSNPTVSVANVENAHHSTRLLAQTTLRNILGTKDMTDLLSDREAISQGMQSTLDEATDRWGIKVERVEIKDVRLPVQLQRAMAAEAEATREARAKVIAAEGEQKAARSLKEAAEIMSSSGAALQLRYLQTLNSISAEKNSTIIFPLPLDMVSAFLKK